MSGQTPGNWFKKGKVVILKGRKEIMKDYFHTSAGCHNCDELNILFESGRSVEAFNPNFLKENPGLIEFVTYDQIKKKSK